MKVMHVETGRHLYGGALQVFYLLRGLHGQGVENLLVCPAGSAISTAAVPFAQIYELPMLGDLDFLFGFHLWRLVRREKPDILHIHSRRGADFWGSLVVRLTGQTAVLTRRVDNPEPSWMARWKYRPYLHLITISEEIRRVMLSEGVPTDKVTCVHSALDTNTYQQTSDQMWFCKEFNLMGDAVAIGVVAQLIKRKGHRFLIEAAPAILEACPEARFMFFGKGPESVALKDLCRQAGLSEVFRFAGFRDDLPKILPNLQLVVHPALMEGLGIALLQASAAGVPIVASRAGGIPEAVRDDVNGVLIEPGDVAGLVRAITSLLQDSARRTRLGRGGKEVVEVEFSEKAMVDGNLGVYRTLDGLCR